MARPRSRTVLDPLDQRSGAWDLSYLAHILDDDSGFSYDIYAEAYARAAKV